MRLARWYALPFLLAACHLASVRTWRDSTLTVDPLNPEGH